MPTAALPDEPSLEQLKKQAKDLRDLARAGVPGALDLVGAHHPKGAHPVTLTGAQLVVARHYGFASWARLKSHIATIERYRRDPDEVERTGDAGSGEVAQVLGLLAQLLEVGVVGKGNGRQGDLLSSPAVRFVRPKGGSRATPFVCAQLGWAQPSPRTGGAPRADGRLARRTAQLRRPCHSRDSVRLHVSAPSRLSSSVPRPPRGWRWGGSS